MCSRSHPSRCSLGNPIPPGPTPAGLLPFLLVGRVFFPLQLSPPTSHSFGLRSVPSYDRKHCLCFRPSNLPHVCSYQEDCPVFDILPLPRATMSSSRVIASKLATGLASTASKAARPAVRTQWSTAASKRTFASKQRTSTGRRTALPGLRRPRTYTP